MFEIETINDIEECVNNIGLIIDNEEYSRLNAFDDIEFHVEQYRIKNDFFRECLNKLPKYLMNDFYEMIHCCPQTINSIRKNFEIVLEK